MFFLLKTIFSVKQIGFSKTVNLTESLSRLIRNEENLFSENIRQKKILLQTECYRRKKKPPFYREVKKKQERQIMHLA